MELKPGQPVFMKGVPGNVWKTGVTDQPVKEPESYCHVRLHPTDY